MSESEMEELERLRAENEQLKQKGSGRHQSEGQREGCSIAVWDGSLPGHALQGTMAARPVEGVGDRGVYSRQRGQAEKEGVARHGGRLVPLVP